MRILKRSTVKEYARDHAPAAAALEIWLAKTEKADWGMPNDIRSDISSIKVLNGERVRFEIGDNYRMIVAFDFPRRTAYIKFIGTHAEYDRIDDVLAIDMF